MNIYISGSLAFDRIMGFNGNFQDYLLMDKLHKLSVCFLVESMDERRGGCAGNVAYSLALLGERPIIVSCAGKDFASYAKHLESVNLSLEGIRILDDAFTANCYITSDKTGNQITGFYPGAMASAADYTFPFLSKGDLAIVSPGNMEDMERFPSIFREKEVRYLFDPGQQLPLFDKERLVRAVKGAFAYICNDYEIEMTCKLLGTKEEGLLKLTEWVVITLGEKGVRLLGRDGTDVRVKAAPCREVVDPTGAGDAQRSGLLLGLSHGLSMPEAAQLGSVSASFAIEHMGTQEHSFTLQEFTQRYEESFGFMPFAL